MQELWLQQRQLPARAEAGTESVGEEGDDTDLQDRDEQLAPSEEQCRQDESQLAGVQTQEESAEAGDFLHSETGPGCAGRAVVASADSCLAC